MCCSLFLMAVVQQLQHVSRLSAAIKDQFPDVREVVLKDFPAEAA